MRAPVCRPSLPPFYERSLSADATPIIQLDKQRLARSCAADRRVPLSRPPQNGSKHRSLSLVKLFRLDDWQQLILGPPRNPLSPETRRHILLVAFFAWVGLGADGLSSANYGPEQSFLALGAHSHLALYLAGLTAITVFVIAFSYNQVIELFPTGGGGYKVATQLVGAHVGLVSGSALIIDYVLTVAISIAGGIDALFSLLPLAAQSFKVPTEIVLILVLMVMNLRDIKESIALLMPIFVGFLVVHALLIVYGIVAHADRLPSLLPDTVNETVFVAGQIGWTSVLSLLLLAYSLGGGTYTGIEAVSNNIDRLAEPRIRTGKITMFYMAASLAFTAAGIILLYLIWDAAPVAGRTLNAVVFGAMIEGWSWNGWPIGAALLTLVLASEAGLLIVAANTGFLGGPAVLANMAADQWLPHQFTYLSSRLVTKNGILLMGGGAIGILLLAGGKISILVVLYSINVFLTFTLSLLGLCIHWCRQRTAHWMRRFILSGVGFVLCAAILGVTLFEKFTEGGWMTAVITGLLIALCILVRRHYVETRRQIDSVDRLFVVKAATPVASPPPLDRSAPTAAFLVGRSLGTGMHSLLWVARLFPGHFKNMVFISVGEVDTQSFGAETAVEKLKAEVEGTLTYYINYCNNRGIAATSYRNFGTDAVAQLTELCAEVAASFPNAVFFASKLIFVRDNWWTRLLHNQTAIAMQRRLHLRGMQMVILPMKVD
ncbi:MAG: APC family permease [Rhodospirillales bacterium]|nr:APC family permease [Rhodospirillales bacterium]